MTPALLPLEFLYWTSYIYIAEGDSMQAQSCGRKSFFSLFCVIRAVWLFGRERLGGRAMR
jgi:hypothetical protein